jgi:hypothetical protein
MLPGWAQEFEPHNVEAYSVADEVTIRIAAKNPGPQVCPRAANPRPPVILGAPHGPVCLCKCDRMSPLQGSLFAASTVAVLVAGATARSSPDTAAPGRLVKAPPGLRGFVTSRRQRQARDLSCSLDRPHLQAQASRFAFPRTSDTRVYTSLIYECAQNHHHPATRGCC